MHIYMYIWCSSFCICQLGFIKSIHQGKASEQGCQGFICRSMCRMVGWWPRSVEWSGGRMVGRSDGWTVGRSAGQMVGQSVGPSDSRSVGRSVGRSHGRFVKGNAAVDLNDASSSLPWCMVLVRENRRHHSSPYIYICICIYISEYVFVYMYKICCFLLFIVILLRHIFKPAA